MTDTSTPPPAGWYAAPDGSPTTWWWDGAQWTEPEAQHSPNPRAIAGIAKLATATQVLLITCGVMSVATIAIEMFGINAIALFFDGYESAVGLLDVYDQSSLVITFLSPLSMLAAGVLWMIWQYRVAKQVAGQTRRSPRWHVWSWIIPIISLWFPYQNISDLWRALGRTRPSWQIAWWLLWITGSYITQISTRIYLSAEDLEGYRAAMWVTIAGEILHLAAVPLAVLVIRGITQRIRERAAEPVQAHAV